jgi:Ca-activated chloride channel family protein
MTFHNFGYLFLLLLLIPTIFWYVWKMHKSDASLQISSLRGLAQVPKSARVRMLVLPFVLRLLAIIFLIIVIARPQSSNSWNTKNVEGIDIMMALDISPSMLAEDLQPTRLDAAKNVATNFIYSRPNDNIGLTTFASGSFTQCPLTTDHTVLVSLLKAVNFGGMNEGTAIGLGLANAVNRVKGGKAKSKVVILLTDGSNNSGDIAPTTAADIAKTFGIRVYTIGIGGNGVATAHVMTPGGIRALQVPAEFDEKTLNDIAVATGGKYFRATSTASLKTVYEEIDKMEKTKFKVQNFSRYNEAFHLFALLALLCLLLEFVVRRIILKRIP